jgi:hypothetical protein
LNRELLLPIFHYKVRLTIFVDYPPLSLTKIDLEKCTALALNTRLTWE